MELFRFSFFLLFDPRKPKLLRMTEDLGLRGEPFPLISLSPSSSSSSFKSALDTGAGSLRVGEGGGLISAED